MTRGGDRKTDEHMRGLERRLQAVFSAAYRKAVEREKAAMEKFAAFDADALRGEGLDDTAIRARQLSHKSSVDRETQLVNHIAAELARAGATAAKMIQGGLLNVYEASYRQALRSVDEQLGFDVSWSVYDKNQLRILLNQEDQAPFTKIAYRKMGSNRVVVRRLQNELAQSVVLGEGTPEIARRIQRVTGQSLSQARRVARTETLRVANQGRMTGCRQAHDEYGIEMDKRWLATLDASTRDPHADMHMEKVPLDEPFSNGLMQPLDPNGPPEETINCRCRIVSVLRGLKGSQAYRELQERIGKDRIYAARASEKGVRDDATEAFSSLSGVETQTGIKIRHVSGHSIARAGERGVRAADVRDALQNPINVGKITTDKQGRSRQTFIGGQATVGINPENGKITTVYPTSSKKRKKYGGG